MKQLLYIISLLFVGVNLQAQITVNTPFKVNSNNPIDTRLNISKITDTVNIVFKYPGLITYVEDTDQFYYYNGNSWSLFEQGSNSFIYTIDSTAQAVGLSTFSLSSNNNLGYPSGTLYSTTSQLYDNDIQAAARLDTNSVYFLSSANDYALPAGIGRVLYPTKTYSSDNEAILNGVDFGDIYAVDSNNIYGMPVYTVKEVRYLREREIEIYRDSSLRSLIAVNDVTIDGANNTLEFDNLSTLNIETNGFNLINSGGFSLLRTVNNPTQRIIEVNQATLRLTGGATESGTKTQFVAADADNDLEVIAPAEALSVIGITRGEVNTPTDASGIITIAHGLGVAPASVQITGITDADRTYVVSNVDASNITVKVYEAGVLQTSTATNFYWTSIK